MKSILHLFRVTMVGGIMFLVPVIVLTIIIGKAFNVARIIVRPMAELMPMESIGGIAASKLLAIAAIVGFCFIAGLFARTGIARKLISWIENALLSNLPGYSFMKGMGENIVGVESDKPHEVVLARIEDAWQIAFLVERVEGGHVAVFVPGAPSPWSGSVFFMTEDRIKPLDIPAMSALRSLRGLGIGTGDLLKGRL